MYSPPTIWGRFWGNFWGSLFSISGQALDKNNPINIKGVIPIMDTLFKYNKKKHPNKIVTRFHNCYRIPHVWTADCR